MPWAKGTADDFIDFLRKVRDFASGSLDPLTDPDFDDGSGVVPSAEQWIVLTNGAGMTNIPGSGFATDGEVYLQGPGSDPSDEIIVGFKTYRNAGANIFGWKMRGFTAFDDGLDWDTLPGLSPQVLAAFDDASFTIYIWVNARRIMALARIGTTDILVHLGFIQQFGTRNQYPYPLLIGGSVVDDTISFQTNHFGHSCMPDPCGLGAQLRWVDGTWQEVNNFTGTSAFRNQARESTGYVMWPQRDPVTSADGSVIGSQDISENGIFENFNSGTAPYVSSSEIDAHTLFSCVLASNLPAPAAIGRVDGLFTMFGLGLIKGDTLTDSSESPAVVYDVFGNTWRSEPPDFFAIRRE